MRKYQTKKQLATFISPTFVIARSILRVKSTLTTLVMYFAVDERRSNLPSLIDYKAFFNIFIKIFVGCAPLHQSSEFCNGQNLLLVRIYGGQEPTLQARDFSHKLAQYLQHPKTPRV